MKIRMIKHLHTRLLREVSHQGEAIALEVPLLNLKGFQHDAEESALTAVSERAQGLKSEIDKYTRDLSLRYDMPEASERDELG